MNVNKTNIIWQNIVLRKIFSEFRKEICVMHMVLKTILSITVNLLLKIFSVLNKK